jgi:hypothetical protein
MGCSKNTSPRHPQITPSAPIRADAGVPDHLHKRLAAAIQNGHLQIVDLHKDVVDPHRVQGAEQMLGCGNQYALPHQTGRITDLGYLLVAGWNREMLQVCSEEHDPG